MATKKLSPALTALLDDIEAGQSNPLRRVAARGARMRLESQLEQRDCLVCPHSIWLCTWRKVNGELELVEHLGACKRYVSLPLADGGIGFAPLMFRCSAVADPAFDGGTGGLMPPDVPRGGVCENERDRAQERDRG